MCTHMRNNLCEIIYGGNEEKKSNNFLLIIIISYIEGRGHTKK